MAAKESKEMSRGLRRERAEDAAVPYFCYLQLDGDEAARQDQGWAEGAMLWWPRLTFGRTEQQQVLGLIATVEGDRKETTAG